MDILPILKKTKDTYAGKQDMEVLPPAFNELSKRMPLIEPVFGRVRDEIQGSTLDEKFGKEMADAIELCK